MPTKSRRVKFDEEIRAAFYLLTNRHERNKEPVSLFLLPNKSITGWKGEERGEPIGTYSSSLGSIDGAREFFTEDCYEALRILKERQQEEEVEESA